MSNRTTLRRKFAQDVRRIEARSLVAHQRLAFGCDHTHTEWRNQGAHATLVCRDCGQVLIDK